MKTVIEMAREAAAHHGHTLKDEPEQATIEFIERFAELVRADEREAFPRLQYVVDWLENGCDPKEAAKELRLYDAAIRARSNK